MDYNQKKNSYHYVYSVLSSMQRSYRRALKLLVEQDALGELDRAEEQIGAIENCIDKLDLIKENISLAHLTEGALISDDELAISTNLVDAFLKIVEEEKEYFLSDDVLLQWTLQKEKELNIIKDTFLLTLSHKLSHKNKLGLIEKH